MMHPYSEILNLSQKIMEVAHKSIMRVEGSIEFVEKKFQQIEEICAGYNVDYICDELEKIEEIFYQGKSIDYAFACIEWRLHDIIEQINEYDREYSPTFAEKHKRPLPFPKEKMLNYAYAKKNEAGKQIERLEDLTQKIQDKASNIEDDHALEQIYVDFNNIGSTFRGSEDSLKMLPETIERLERLNTKIGLGKATSLESPYFFRNYVDAYNALEATFDQIEKIQGEDFDVWKVVEIEEKLRDDAWAEKYDIALNNALTNAHALKKEVLKQQGKSCALKGDKINWEKLQAENPQLLEKPKKHIKR